MQLIVVLYVLYMSIIWKVLVSVFDFVQYVNGVCMVTDGICMCNVTFVRMYIHTVHTFTFCIYV